MISDEKYSNISGENFFVELEKDMRTQIQPLLKNILLAMDIDRAVILSTFDEDSINEIEKYMRYEFTASDMIRPNEELINYLGKFVDKQKKFVLSYGHKLMLNAMVRECQKITKLSNTSENRSSNAVVTTNQDVAGSVVKVTASRSLTQEAAVESKEELITALSQSISRWIRNHSALAQVRLGELSFKVVRDTYKLRDDGIQCSIKCPVESCHETFSVSYKSYPSSYKPKKKSVEKQRALPHRWYIYLVQLHMLKCHSDKDVVGEGLIENEEQPIEQSSSNVNSLDSHSQRESRQLTRPPSASIDNDTVSADQPIEESSSNSQRQQANRQLTRRRPAAINDAVSDNLPIEQPSIDNNSHRPSVDSLQHVERRCRKRIINNSNKHVPSKLRKM